MRLSANPLRIAVDQSRVEFRAFLDFFDAYEQGFARRLFYALSGFNHDANIWWLSAFSLRICSWSESRCCSGAEALHFPAARRERPEILISAPIRAHEEPLAIG